MIPRSFIFSHCASCSEPAQDVMANCGSCKNSFHLDCINYDEAEINKILLFFCESCTFNKAYPKIIYKDYTKEHTKPLFKKHEMLSIHNLYPYYCLLELYKILKQPLGKEPFRRWEPFGIHNSSGFPNRIPAISLKNVQVGAVPSSTVYLQPL